MAPYNFLSLSEVFFPNKSRPNKSLKSKKNMIFYLRMFKILWNDPIIIMIKKDKEFFF